MPMCRRVIALSAALLAAAGLRAQSPLELPTPGGRFAVGRTTLFRIDSTRGEPATRDTTDLRQVVLNIWYPAEAASGTRAPYMPSATAYRGTVSDEVLAIWASTTTQVREGAAAVSGRFPVLLFSHGWNSRTGSYSMWLSEVASHGFVVIGIDHPYLGSVALSNGQVPEATMNHFGEVRWTPDLFYSDDVAFVLRSLGDLDAGDRILRGHLNVDHVFGAGHSSGFGTAISPFAQRYPGLKGLISFDSGVSGIGRARGFDVPLLLVRADDPSYTDILVRGPRTHPRGTIYDSSFVRAMHAPFFDLQILGSGHNAVFDNLSLQVDPATQDQVARNHRLINQYTIEFLRSLLAEAPDLTVRPGDANLVRVRRVSLP